MNGIPWHTAIHYHSQNVLMWLKNCLNGQKIESSFQQCTLTIQFLICMLLRQAALLTHILEILSIGTDRDKQTVWIQIRLLLRSILVKVNIICHSVCIFWMIYCIVKPGPEVRKLFFTLNSAEHEISHAHKYENVKKFSFFLAQISLECYFSSS